MIDYNKEIFKALSTLAPTYHEYSLSTDTAEVPCLSYMELTNVDSVTGETLGYSTITFRVKVWAHSYKEIQELSLEVDKIMRPLGFKRIQSAILSDKKSTMIQKILGYQALGLEQY